ncbi:Hypothetical_protein [Hexamita inflata]|uniref:Hypothetical_protein n=1 Tax=Hexamita inflata TaxID=28002 RepID=A0AA86Q7J9_9EUKA|nr:Hypothetical protein HINF_LOCUS16977 [Hexamita inflata]CAI9953805.1 Hypothetical protein HINF_LOCUS41450 [Hexamita inflata]
MQKQQILPWILKEAKYNQYITLISAISCQNSLQLDFNSISEVHGCVDLNPSELKLMLEFSKNPSQSRKQLFQFNKLLFFVILEHSNSIFYLDITGQFILSVSYGEADKCAVILFKADELVLIQDFVVKCESQLSER